MSFVSDELLVDANTPAPYAMRVTGKLGTFRVTKQKGQYAGMTPRYGAFTVLLTEESAIVIQGLIADIQQITNGYDAGDEITIAYDPKAVLLPTGQMVQNNNLLILNEEDAATSDPVDEELRQLMAEQDAELDTEVDHDYQREYRNIDTLADEVESVYDEDDIPF